MQTRDTIVEQLNISRNNVVHIMANISGREESQAEILLLLILGYIVLLSLLLLIHRKLLKKQKTIHENLVLTYDTIRYQLAKVQYRMTALQEGKGINIVMESDHKNYLANATAIKEEILALEQKNGQQIVSADQWNMIHTQTNKKNRLTIGVQIIGRITTIITLGIYKLFW